MDTKEVLWNYFTSTGKIGSYLLLKGIEKVDDVKYSCSIGEKEDNGRVSIERSDNFKKSGL